MGNTPKKLKVLIFGKEPPKLNPEGIRSLLQHSLKLSKNDPKIFLKTLVVSKKFLSIASRYPVYTLIVCSKGNDDFSVSFGKKIDLTDFWHPWFLEKTARSINQSYNRAFGLMKLLAPKHFYLDLEHVEESSEALGQYEALFGLVRNGKIGLKLPRLYRRSLGSAKSKYAPTLKRLAPYLNLLECDFIYLKKADVVSTLDLDYFVTRSFRNKDAFKDLLRYNIRKITMDCFEIDEEINESDLKELQANSTLQFLEILCFIGSYKSLGGFFDLLKHHCPHLRSLDLSFYFHDDTLCPYDAGMSMEEVLKNLPTIHEKLKSLKDHSPSSLSSLLICAESEFHIYQNSTLDDNWPDKLKHHEGFQRINRIYDIGFDRAEFKSEYGSFTLIHDVKIRSEYDRYSEESSDSDSDDSSDGD